MTIPAWRSAAILTRAASGLACGAFRTASLNTPVDFDIVRRPVTAVSCAECLVTF